MKLKHLHLVIAAQLVCLIATQNEESYDTNEWIPVTQKPGEEITQKKATARVLNLDSPSQKFFSDEIKFKKIRPNFQSRPKHKDRYNVPKYESVYKFEQPPSFPQAGIGKFQYFPKQAVQHPIYQQKPSLEVYRPPPLPQYVQNSQTAFSNVPNNVPQFTIPLNGSNYYQTINPLSINQQLSGNIQFQGPNGVGIQFKHPGPVNHDNKIHQYPGSITGGQVAFTNTNGVDYANKQVLSGQPQAAADIQKESVQLVYVPLENLKENSQLITQDTQTIYKQVESPKYENPLDKQHRLAVIEQDFIQQALQATKLQEQIQQGNPILYQISTTPKPIKKRKPHQPPLAVYVEGENQHVSLSDVLEALKDAKSISVQDSIQSDSPQIFIGPSTLESTEYSKFPLPYLNGIDGNRLNKNVENLPFFVAPLSFKTPPGFSKIPLPAPHVGSVVISNKEDLQDKRSTSKPNEFNDSTNKQSINSVSSTTPRSNHNSLNVQPYFGQSYYDPVQFVSSPQPQTFDEKQQEYTLSTTSYNHKPSETEYNKPVNSQSNIEAEVLLNSKDSTKPAFQYAYIDEIATGPTSVGNSQLSSTYPSSQDIFNPSIYQDTSGGQQEEIVSIRPKPEAVTHYSSSRQKTTTKDRLPDVNPLELAINEFELHEINTQLEEKPRIKNQNNYKESHSQIADDNDYRYRNSYKTRPSQTEKQKYTHQRTTATSSQNEEDTGYRFDPELHRFSSTPLSILRDSYVETTTRPVSKQRGRTRARPTTTTTTTTTTTAPQAEEHYTVLEEFDVRDQSSKQQTNPSNVNYATQTDQIQVEPVQNQPKTDLTQYSGSFTEIENIPTNVYSLNPKPEKTYFDQFYTLNQNRPILNSNARPNGDNYEQQGQFEVSPHTNSASQGEYKQEQQVPVQYLNSFEDPSVRSLLIPNLLVPTTTNSLYAGPSYLPTTEKIISTTTTTTTTTTENPITTTTTTVPNSRTRSRTRGGSRYSGSTTTKRPVSRRKPTNSRVKIEHTRNPTEVEYATRNSNTKQRFRSRVNTTPDSITERLSTTENQIYRASSSNAPLNLHTHPDGSESYMQYEQVVDNKPEERLLSADYPKFPSTSARPVIQYENTASSPKPVLNVQVTYPVETYQYEQEETPKVKVRSRIRERPRVTSTTTERVTLKPVVNEEAGNEFFGFFRQPNFGPPMNIKQEVVTTPTRIFSYQTEDYQVTDSTDSSTVKFVGEIVPKYTSREVETETPKPRLRTRTRPNVRKSNSRQDIVEQTTKRNTVVRSRGKTHYRIPENMKKPIDEEADVEGGNYPRYFQETRGVTTPRNEFQITVAPEEYEDDQAPHSSVNRPNVVASPKEWHEASLSDHVSDGDPQNNSLLSEQPLSTDEPFALPLMKSSLEESSTDGSDERFRKTSQQIEQQFEAINSFNEPKKEENKEKKKKRKGVWKLVKQRPVDRLETSESQNYFSVLNSYQDIKKVKDEHIHLESESATNANIENKTLVTNTQFFTENYSTGMPDNVVKESKEINQKPISKNHQEEFITDNKKISTITSTPSTEYTTKTEEDFIDSIYEMFGINRNNSNTAVTETDSEPTLTTTQNPTFPEELTEASFSTEPATETTTWQDIFTTFSVVGKRQDNKILPHQVEPWDMKLVRTSTSTEVSHETEICYRGRCIRSPDKKENLKK